MKKGIFNALLTAIVFVTLEPVSKLIAGDVSPYAITFWRFAIGSLILIPFAVVKIKKEKLHVTKKDMGVMTLLGILFICISMVALQIAVKIADSPSLIAIIFSSNSVFTMLFAVLIVKEKMTWQKWCTLVLCTIGVLICADFKSGTNLASVALAIFAAVSFSLYTVLSQKFMTELGSAVQTSIVFVMGSIVLIIALIIGGADVIPQFDGRSVSILCYLGFIVTGIGYWSYFNAIEKSGAIMGSLAFFIKPILTPFATFAINGIIPDIKVFVAVFFIVCGSYIAVYKKNSKKSEIKSE